MVCSGFEDNSGAVLVGRDVIDTGWEVDADGAFNAVAIDTVGDFGDVDTVTALISIGSVRTLQCTIGSVGSINGLETHSESFLGLLMTFLFSMSSLTLINQTGNLFRFFTNAAS